MSRIRRKNTGSSGPTKKQKTIDLGYNEDDEHLDSESEQEDLLEPSLADDDDIEEEETLDAKKVRLAREYLEKLEAGDSDDSSSSDDDDDDNDSETLHDRIGVRLQRERLKREGTLERAVADKVDKSIAQFRESLETLEGEAKAWIKSGRVKLLRGHDLTPTCVAMQSDGEKAISGSKDHSVIIWDVESEKRALTLCKTWKKQQQNDLSRVEGEILSVACSDDGHYATVGRRDATVSVFDIRAGRNNLVKTFTGHKGPVTCLGFRTQSLQMFSGSDDRCIRYGFFCYWSVSLIN
jgi:ribosomal RNA-processing protein 9